MENVITYQEEDRVEQLQRILEREQKSEITYTEASEIGDSLIKFFEILADESDEIES